MRPEPEDDQQTVPGAVSKALSGHRSESANGLHSEALIARSYLEAGTVLLGRFKIVRHLGSGGMGDVYEAQDLLMQEGRIALKTIRPDLIADREQLARFKNEVHLARKVSDPHVCRIHELFQTGPDGPPLAFLTMEFLEGETLADRLHLSGPLPWSETRTVALGICEALTSIHQAGIIHRDLKGRNVMLATRNGMRCTVLMDFGIARQISRHTGDTITALTQTGMMVGTPDYMAPEQFDGSEVTQAADVYALGVLLFEIATGERPFSERILARAAESKAKAAGSKTNSARTKNRVPVRASAIQAGVPRRFDIVVAKCLEYDAARRYQSAQEVAKAIRGRVSLAELVRRPLVLAASVLAMLLLCGLLLIPTVGERLRGILLSSSEKHVAILPFEVPNGSPEIVALGDGLMDSMAGDLANLDTVNRTLWVIPASEIRARKVTSAASAMHEFGATIVISGSFERDANGSHLKLTLMDPKKAREIGFVVVSSAAGDLAAMESEAITRLGRLMNISVKDEPVSASKDAGSHAAYEDYLAGLGYFQRFDKPGNLDLATAALQRAIKTDPKFSLAYARLAQVYIMRYRLDSKPQWLRQAEATCKQAAELDDRVPSTYVALAQVHEFTGNHDLAIQEFQRAVSLDPRDTEAIAGMASSYQSEGRNADAEAAYVRAAALRSSDWKGYNDLGNFYDQIGKPKDAVAQYQRALELTPDNSGVYANLGNAYMDLDDPTMTGKAEEALERSIAITPNYGAYGNLGFLYSKQHRFAESIEASKKALEFNNQDYNVWSNLTAAYEWVNNVEKANAARAQTIKLLEDSIKLNPQSAEAQATLAALRAKIGLNQQSLEGIRISLALSPKSQYVLSQVADAYELLGDRRNAIKYLNEALINGLPQQQLSGDPEIQGVLSDHNFRAQVTN